MRYTTIFAVLLLVLCSFVRPVSAEEIPIVESNVISATVLPNGAEEVRSATVDLAKGINRIVIKPLPSSCDTNTIRIKVVSTAQITINGMNITSIPVYNISKEEIEKVKAEIEDLNMQIEMQKDDRAILEIRVSTAGVLVTNLRNNMTRALAMGQGLPPDLGGKLNFLTSDIAVSKTKMDEISRSIAELTKKIDDLKKAYPAAVSSSGISHETGVTVELTASAAGKADIVLTYQVGDASWSPSYRLDFRPTEEKLDVELLANVIMGDSLNWDDIDLTLATSTPNGALTPPDPSPWYMTFSSDKNLFEEFGHGATAIKLPQTKTISGKIELINTYTDNPIMNSEVSSQAGLSYTIDLGGGHSLTPNWVKQFRVAGFSVPAKLSNIVIPELDDKVYIQALVTNTSPYPILEGEARCYIEGMLCGSSKTVLVPPGSEKHFPLGIEKRVKVERFASVENDEKGDKIRRNHGVRIELTNSAATDMELSLKERIPISNNDDIKVSGEKLSQKPDERTPEGILTWKLRLAPGEKKVIEIAYYVEYPKESTIISE